MKVIREMYNGDDTKLSHVSYSLRQSFKIIQ